MSKIAYFFVSFLGAIPAGGTLYLMIQNFLDRADRLGTTLLAVTILISVCMVAVALTPFMILVFYKDPRPKAPARKGDDDDGDEPEAAVVADDDGDDEGFGDVIPDNYDPDELAASVDDEAEGFDDDEYDDDGFEDDDDFDYEDE